MTLLMFYVTFLFACLKLSVMIERKRPFIVTNIDKTAFTNGETITTQLPSFNMAVGATNFLTGVKDDLRFFKWIAIQRIHEENKEEKQLIHELHTCTDEDLARFDEADDGSVARLSVFKKSNALYCLDW